MIVEFFQKGKRFFALEHSFLKSPWRGHRVLVLQYHKVAPHELAGLLADMPSVGWSVDDTRTTNSHPKELTKPASEGKLKVFIQRNGSGQGRI
jgi:hypothetical protein